MDLSDTTALEALARAQVAELSARIAAELTAIVDERTKIRRWCDDEEYIYNRVVRPRIEHIKALTLEREMLMKPLVSLERTRLPKQFIVNSAGAIALSEIA